MYCTHQHEPVTGSSELSAQRPVTRSFDVFFDLHPNKQLSKQWWGWWFEMQSCPLWRHRNARDIWDRLLQMWRKLKLIFSCSKFPKHVSNVHWVIIFSNETLTCVCTCTRRLDVKHIIPNAITLHMVTHHCSLYVYDVHMYMSLI